MSATQGVPQTDRRAANQTRYIMGKPYHYVIENGRQVLRKGVAPKDVKAAAADLAQGGDLNSFLDALGVPKS